MFYLYKIVNLLNNKIYIGQSIDPCDRWYRHKKDARNPKRTISHAIKKYGSDNFSFEVIATSKTLDDANETEVELILRYQSHVSFGNGYNVNWGGNNAPKSDEQKRKTSLSLKGHPVSLETRQKLSLALKGKEKPALRGKPLSEEHKIKLSKIHKGRKNPACAFWRGKKLSAEHKKNMSEALQKLTRDQIAKIKIDPRSSRKIAIDYGVSHTLILRVKKKQ